MKEAVIRKLKDILMEILEIDLTNEQVAAMEKIDEHGIDSVQILEFLLKVEKEFDMEISEDDLDIELIRNLDHLSEYLVTHGKTADP